MLALEDGTGNPRWKPGNFILVGVDVMAYKSILRNGLDELFDELASEFGPPRILSPEESYKVTTTIEKEIQDYLRKFKQRLHKSEEASKKIILTC